MKKLLILLTLCSITASTSCSSTVDTVPLDETKYTGGIILEWNEAVHEVLGGDTYEHGLLTSRMYAMVHLAMHDAVNAVSKSYELYHYNGSNELADPAVAASVAAHRILSQTFSDATAYLDALLINTAGQKYGIPYTEGEKLGIEVADAYLALRADDGAFENPIAPIHSTQAPGEFSEVPGFPFIFAPHWKEMRPFGLENPEQFRSAPHPELYSEKYAIDFNEVKSQGVLNSAIRTEDQTNYALFWEEWSEMGWNRIARIVLAQNQYNLTETARIFALLNMSLADAYIAGWDSKYHYNFWRPITAIRNADIDGNPETENDLDWEPLIPTPPVQDYPSTHSALGNAAAAILAGILGDDTEFTFVSTTGASADYPRSFESFSQAADENADSRVQIGFHFRFACEAGQKLGDEIGKWVIDNHLRPLN